VCMCSSAADVRSICSVEFSACGDDVGMLKMYVKSSSVCDAAAVFTANAALLDAELNKVISAICRGRNPHHSETAAAGLIPLKLWP
jgi:hypothetical protein